VVEVFESAIDGKAVLRISWLIWVANRRHRIQLIGIQTTTEIMSRQTVDGQHRANKPAIKGDGMFDSIISLDVAIRTGVAEGAPGSMSNIYSVDFGSRSSVSRDDIFAAALKWARKTFETAAPKIAFLEALVPQYDKTIQCGLWAIIAGTARLNGIEMREVAVQTWRSFVLSHGRLPKREAKARAIQVCARLGWPVKNDDEAEAACIWLWGCAQVAPKLAPQIPLFMRGAA
jgi:hypothetical protein